MAKEVVTKFRLETSQFDSKLKDAAKELSKITREAEKTGRGFDAMTRGSVESARALGRIQTSSTTAKGKVKELTDSFNMLAKEYNKLSEEQKRNDFGKAIAGSLTTLKGRIDEAKREMQSLSNGVDAAGKSSGSMGGVLEGITSKLGNLGGKFGMSSEMAGMLTSSTMGLTAAIGAGAAADGLCGRPLHRRCAADVLPLRGLCRHLRHGGRG